MHPIENIMQTSMEQIKRMVDVNTVVGNPIVTAGNTMILPVSKLSLAFLVGGGEYGHMCSAKKAADEANRDSRFPFAGTSAVGMCITPLAFITEEQGNVRVMPADRKSSTDRLVDMIPQVLKCVEKLINTGIDCINKKCACADSEKKQNQKTNSNCGCGCTAVTDGTTSGVLDALPVQEALPDKNYGDAQLVSANETSNDKYFEQARLTRSKTRDEALDTMQQALKNAELSETEKTAVTQTLTNTINSITVESDIENMVKAKGFADCVAFIEGEKINLAVKTGSEGLDKSEVAQLRDIILGKMETEAKNISIVEVK